MKRYMAMILVVLTLAAGPVTAAPSADDSEEGQLAESIRETVRRYDLNGKEKYVIDFHFSPLHAMRAYREMLLASAMPGLDNSLKEELRQTVAMGLGAVYRDSGAGVPLPAAGEGAVAMAFDYSLPRYTQTPNPQQPASLRWTEKDLRPTVGPASIGQSLAAKAVWLQRAGGEGSGLMVASLLRELEIVTQAPFMADDEQVRVPERLRWEEGAWTIEDEGSRLLSQASLLLGLLETRALLEAPARLPGHGAADGLLGQPIQAWRERTAWAISRLFRGIMAGFRQPETGLLVGHVGPEGRADRVVLEDLGLAAEALAVLAGDTAMAESEEARQVLTRQAEFVQRMLGEEALAPRGWFLPMEAAWNGTVTTLGDQLAALTVLQEAAAATGREGFQEAGRALRQRMHEPFWSKGDRIYRSAVGYDVSAYDGYLFGTVLACLRRAGTSDGELDGTVQRYVEKVLKEGGLLQTEGMATGEPAFPEALIDAEVPALKKRLKGLEGKERGDRVTAFIRRVIDRDGDSVPGPRYGGGRYGAAPVVVVQTSIQTPFEEPEPASDEEEGT